MDISTKTATKTVTQTTYSTTVSAEEISALAMVAVKNKIAFDGQGDVLAKATRNDDGSVDVEVVIETQATTDAQPAGTQTPLPVIPMGLTAPAA